jgi:hypothetical protein
MVGLSELMRPTSGRPEIAIALLDGPIDRDHAGLQGARLSTLLDVAADRDRSAGAHGTAVAAMFVAARDHEALGICPECTLLVRPTFRETSAGLAAASPSQPGEAIVVAAAGNQGTLGTSAIARHLWVVPVAACDRDGPPMSRWTLAASVDRRGLAASGELTGVLLDGAPSALAGTSFAKLLVSATIARLWSLYPEAPAPVVRDAATHGGRGRPGAVAPPVLDARVVHAVIAARQGRPMPQEPGGR